MFLLNAVALRIAKMKFFFRIAATKDAVLS
jgi:hypothetical protein